MSFQPAGERLLIKMDDPETTTSSGIVIPEVARDRPTIGSVVAVGEPLDGGSIGLRVLVRAHAGTTLKIEGEEFEVVALVDVLGWWA